MDLWQIKCQCLVHPIIQRESGLHWNIILLTYWIGTQRYTADHAGHIWDIQSNKSRWLTVQIKITVAYHMHNSQKMQQNHARYTSSVVRVHSACAHTSWPYNFHWFLFLQTFAHSVPFQRVSRLSKQLFRGHSEKKESENPTVQAFHRIIWNFPQISIKF